MNFVNAHRRVECVGMATPIGRRLDHWHGGHNAGGCRAHFRLARIGVGAGRQHFTRTGADFELVQRTSGHPGQEYFPDTAFAAQAHGVPAAIPEIKVAHHTDARSVGRPYGKTGALDTIHFTRVGTQHFIGPQVGAFTQ